MFIVLEGIDGAGKSYQAQNLYLRLLKENQRVVFLWEPGFTPLGENAREFLKSGMPLSQKAEILLFMACRAELSDYIKRFLDDGVHVICDRFSPSTLAYQGYGNQLDVLELDRIDLLNKYALSGIQPDKIILLDIPPESQVDRISPLNQDRFEAMDMAYYHRVRDGYLRQAYSDLTQWTIIDGLLPKDEIASMIWVEVYDIIEECKEIMEVNNGSC